MAGDRNSDITFTQRMFSSSAGALLTSFFVTPLDVVKIRLQAQQKEFVKNKCFLYCNGLMEHLCYCVNGNSGAVTTPKWYKRPGHFSGTTDAFIKIARYEGITSLWSGLPPTLLMAIPATVLYFTLYDQLRAQLTRLSKAAQTPLWVPVTAGGCARIFSATMISPLELIRTKMQSKKLSYVEIGQAVRSLIHYQGFFSLWRGLGPTILRDVPFSCLYWLNYEFLKQQFNQEQPVFWFSFAAGATSGTVAAVLTLPFDVIKTHRQIELGEQEIQNGKKKTTTYHLLKKLYQQRGPQALFAGLVPRVVKIAPACAIMISSYEFGKSFFRNYNENKLKARSEVHV